MARGSALSDEIRRDDRLPVAGRESVCGAPEQCDAERAEDDPDTKMPPADERGEAGVRDSVRCAQRPSAREMRRRERPWADARFDVRDLERAREQVLRILTQLVAAAPRVADDDLLPTDAAGVITVAISDVRPPRKRRAAENELEPRRPQPARAARMCEGPIDGHEPHAAPIYRQMGATRDAPREAGRVDASGLEGGNLRQVEDVAHVDARAGDLDATEAVDGEVAERMGGCRDRQRERCHGCKQKCDAFHAAYRRATGAQRTEKCAFRSSARRNHRLASARSPRQRSIMARWKNLVASWVPSLSACFEYDSASPHRPLRASAHARTSSPSIDGRSPRAVRASATVRGRSTPWSMSKRAVSRSTLTPPARWSRAIAATSRYCRRAATRSPATRRRSPRFATYCGRGRTSAAWRESEIARESLPWAASTCASASSAETYSGRTRKPSRYSCSAVRAFPCAHDSLPSWV